MMSSYKISAIMPVHNTPVEYLQECLNSILSQTFTDFELICVDDCSDIIETKELIYRYMKEGSLKEFKLITLKSPQGAAQARNHGLEIAKGDYVIFLDSDDVFNETMLEKLYMKALTDKADVCICGYEIFEQSLSKKRQCVKKVECIYIDKKDELLLCKIPINPWTKLVKRDFLKATNIKFQAISSCNDVYYSVMSVFCAKKIAIVEECLIAYRTGTCTQITFNRDISNIYLAVDKIRNDIRKTKYYKSEYELMLDALLLVTMIEELKECLRIENCRDLYDICRTYFIRSKRRFINKSLATWREMTIRYPFESLWFTYVGDFKRQFEYNRDRIIPILLEKNNVLWGLGKRGEAFLNWAENNNITLSAVCDKSNNRCGEIIHDSIRVINTEEALEMGKDANTRIIASNYSVFEDIGQYAELKNIVNLEEFCPI